MVLVEDASEAVVAADVEVGELDRVSGWFGEGAAWGGAVEGSVGAVLVVELFVLVQGVPEVVLVPDGGAVQRFSAKAEYPAFHDRVHARNTGAAEDDLDTGVGENLVEQGGYFASRSRIRYLTRAPACSRSMARFLAAWVAQAAVGWAVVPRARIRRVACSMTARMY